MNPRLLIAIAIAALLLVAAGLAWQQQEREPTHAPAEEQTTPLSTSPATSPTPAITASPARTGLVMERSESALPTREAVPAVAMAQHPQGLTGRAVTVDDQPLSGLAVHLAESASNDPLSPDLLLQQGHALAPVATTETTADGSFAIGLPVAQSKIYELYIVSSTHATARVGGLRLLAGQWHDLGAITLMPGATLRGRVTVAGRNDIPVPQAIVTVEIGSAFADAALRALPESAAGLTTTAAADGSYQLEHVPSRGVVQVTAAAPGFARVIRSDIQLQRDEPTVVDFELPPGLTIGGSVANDRSEPVVGASIEAWPMKSAGNALRSRSDSRGNFLVVGLIDGPYRVRVSASGFETWQRVEVAAGQLDLRCTLTARSWASVRVTTPTGAVVRNYRLGMRRYFPEQGGKVGTLADVPDQEVHLDGFADRFELRDLPVGNLICEVEAAGFAKTLSLPLDNTAHPNNLLPREHLVEVTMTVGGTLHGRVIDESGAPMAHATVSTMSDGALPDSPLHQLLAGALPERISAVRAETAADGTFTLRPLAFADYQLVVEHPEACRTIESGIRVTNEQTRQLPPIRMARGALVQGHITRGGAPIVGQAKIVLSTAGAESGRNALRIETISRADGSFVLPRRVPAGNYELRAAVVGNAEPEAQIFQQLLQLQRSLSTVSIAPGQGLVQRDIDLPER